MCTTSVIIILFLVWFLLQTLQLTDVLSLQSGPYTLDSHNVYLGQQGKHTYVMWLCLSRYLLTSESSIDHHLALSSASPYTAIELHL